MFYMYREGCFGPKKHIKKPIQKYKEKFALLVVFIITDDNTRINHFDYFSRYWIIFCKLIRLFNTESVISL